MDQRSIDSEAAPTNVATVKLRYAAAAQNPFGGEETLRDARYEVRLAVSSAEIESALRLRHDVFSVELGGVNGASAEEERQRGALECDEFDAICEHLIIVERDSGRTVGTYRVNTLETAGGVEGFYSFSEFDLFRLAPGILCGGVEIGRACIAPDHRSTRALMLLWRGLARFMRARSKSYIFGCCSIFTRDEALGEAAFGLLQKGGHLHRSLFLENRRSGSRRQTASAASDNVELPPLFDMYLRLGAKICSGPVVDSEFGTIDFFALLDLADIPASYRRVLLID